MTHAQIEDQEQIVRKFKIASLNMPVRQVYFYSNDTNQELVAYPGRLGSDFTYRGNPEMTIYKLSKDTAGTEVRIPVGKFVFKGQASEWILFINKDRTGDNYSIIGYPNTSNLADRGGQFDFINLSSKPVIGIFGDQKIAIEMGERSTLKKNQIKLAKNKSATQIQFAFRTQDDWKRFYTNIWPVDENRASTIVFYNKPGTDSVELNWISEMLNN
ncbi:hypothetical protein [Cerasicoccus fimbriatus]|uniref:hypothetical protein n=1 Tax=Cerasicoccus fimbriatus TaxID=3014554 RepID=UPI0022B2B13E|nr:hypothetical protein [Cerasicoccus sp. TK19100]